MGAVCGKGHSLQEDDAPYETKDTASRSGEKKAGKNKEEPVSVQSAEIAQNGDENLVEEVEDVIQQKEAEEVKSEIKPAVGGGGKVQFPEQQDIQKYIDPEKSTTCFGTDLEGATLVAQKSEVFAPSVFHYTFGLNCCACRLPLNDACTVILGYTFHQSCLFCVSCNAHLTGVKKKSDITITPSGQLKCDSCSVNDAPLICGGCLEPVEEEDVDLTIAVAGKRFHHTCVKCSSCQLPLSSVKLLKNDKLFCVTCYTDSLAPTCHHCYRKIIGRSLQIDSNNYHIDCVKCPKCAFKICENEGVYILEGQPPVHMDCSKSVSSEFYKVTTDDEALFSTFEDLGSDSDRGGNFSEARKAKSDISYSSINTSFSSLPFPRTDKPEMAIPAVYRLKYANQYVGSYLKPERDFKAKTADAAFISSLLQAPNSNNKLLTNGSKVNGGVRPNMSPKPVQNGCLSVASTKPGMPTPRKIDSHDYSGPLAAVYYKKERERRRQEKARLSKINKADILKMSANPSGGKFANGHGSDLDHSGMSESETEPDVSRSFNQTGDVSLRAYEGDVSVTTNLDSTNFSSDADSPVSKNLPRGVLMQRGAPNGAISEGSDTENETTVKAPINIASSDTENDTTDGGPGMMNMDTYANGDVPVKRGSSVSSKTFDIYGSDHESKGGGYITEDEIDRMKSGLGKEILREMKVQMDSTNKDEADALQVPDDPIKASRSPDAKTEVQLPYFCELKFGPIATGINRYCDSWLLEQASKEPMSLQDYSSFMHGFHRFTTASNEPWKNSIPNSLADGAMSDTEGMRRYTTAGGSITGTGTRLHSGYKSDGYKSDIGGYNSSPEMGRRKMIRYNSLDVRKAWYHERFLTYVQMYHRRGNLLFEQQKEACMQHIRKSIGSLSRSADLKVYPKEKLFTNMNKRLPEDVNRSRLEMHLSDEEFVDLFAMTQDQFKALPPWKQNVLKQLNYLF